MEAEGRSDVAVGTQLEGAMVNGCSAIEEGDGTQLSTGGDSGGETVWRSSGCREVTVDADNVRRKRQGEARWQEVVGRSMGRGVQG